MPDHSLFAMQIIPFSISDDSAAEIDGLARYEENVLTLEFQMKGSFFGLIKAHVKTVRLPLADIVTARFKKGMFGAVFSLRVRSMTLIEEVPGAKRGELKLRFARKHRDDAHEFASRLQLHLSERKLELLDDEMRRLEEPDD